MKEISLTKNQIALVDDEDFDYLDQWEWRASWSEKPKTFYARRLGDDKMMHRIIMDTPNELLVDHLNHNGLDNRKYNLRNVNHTKNNLNRRVLKSNKLGVRGVSITASGKYVSAIKINKKEHHLGTFESVEQASTAYESALVSLYPDLAIDNSLFLGE